MAQWWASYILRNAPRYGLDPRAALAIARVEGLSGAVGDNGTSFGPFQLHAGGALPRGRGRAWAESAAGIDYALQRMSASGARGKSGYAAVSAISRNFERPADPAGEISKAWGLYGHGAQSSNPQSSGMTGGLDMGGAPALSSGGDDFKRAAAGFLLARADATARGSSSPLGGLLELAQMRQSLGTAPPSMVPSAATGAPGVGGKAQHGSLAELFYDPIGAIKNGQEIAPVGGHSDHVHIASTSRATMRQAINEARAMGLRASENPQAGGVHPVHVKDSYHYRTIPGTHMGEALDVSGSPQQMARFYRWAARRYR